MTLITELTQEEVDAIIYDARAGDLESLKEIFDMIEHKLLNSMQAEHSLSTPIHMAAANGHDEVLQFLLSLISAEEAKVLVNKQNDSGNTALHWAALNDHVKTVEILCDFGADPFLRNTAGHDAIYEAENNNKEEAEAYLLKRYAVEPLEDEEINIAIKEGTEIEDATKDSFAAEKELTDLKELEQKTKDLEI